MKTMFRDDLMKGERILVTGGGTGLGKAMTEAFMELGADCVIWGRRGGVLQETADELMEKTGARCDVAAVDIRNAGAIEDAMEEAFAGGPLTGVVNNAAGNFVSPTERLSANAFNAIASIVAHGTFNVTVAAGKRWIEAGNKGSILSIVASWVWNGGPFTVPSAMSKAGVAVMTQSLASEWGPKGIRANAIAPGPFKSEGMEKRLMPEPLAKKLGSGDMGARGNPMGRWGEHRELQNLACYLMAPGSEYVNGEVIAIDGGQWLAGGGNFSAMSQLTSEDWDLVNESIRKTNEADRAKRTT
ncbi:MULTISPECIES: SDR family oxidoreductase [Pacificimonas]|nr:MULTISPECIES: SDR family oxidoreductase [Pacificimonas]MBZ6377047.1 SDR family oxidoreductase [Pacificimonas aurantium]